MSQKLCPAPKNDPHGLQESKVKKAHWVSFLWICFLRKEKCFSSEISGSTESLTSWSFHYEHTKVWLGRHTGGWIKYKHENTGAQKTQRIHEGCGFVNHFHWIPTLANAIFRNVVFQLPIPLCVCVCVCVCVKEWERERESVCVCACAHISVCVRACVCTHLCVCVCALSWCFDFVCYSVSVWSWTQTGIHISCHCCSKHFRHFPPSKLKCPLV